MTPEQKMLVQETFAQIKPISDQAAGLFYQRLFELDPEVKPLFKGDMTEQGRMLMQTIGVAVAHLNNLGEIAPSIEQLAKRHVDYGVEASHYDTVGKALLWTLGQGLGENFTPAVKEAWTTLYIILADTMKKAAYN